ncbi:MAG: hypothetical protein P8188_17170 [Gemmatimonadota bacterium]
MELSILLGAAGTCALGAVLPWISTEAVLLGALLALPASWVPAAVAACAAGQMTGKAGLYLLARSAPHRLPDRAAGVLARARGLARRPRFLAAAVLTGSAVALPPFYLITLASGLARLPFALFTAAGLLGCLLRYGVLAWGAGMLGLGGAA